MTLEKLRKKRTDLRESAKKILADYTDDGNIPDEVLRAYSVAIKQMKMLDSQIEHMETAQRVIVENAVLPYYRCPTCEVYLSIGDKEEEMAYCLRCGQKLDWEHVVRA